MMEEMDVQEITLLEVYNNVTNRPVVREAFGFACYIREEHLLFDTGGNGQVLLNNLSAMQIEPEQIAKVVLSHDHGDHTGGLAALLARNPGIPVYVHEGFGPQTREVIRRHGTLCMVRGWEEIAPGIFSTGPLRGAAAEQSLAISIQGGFMIVSGCAHPHIGTIISHVSRFGTVLGVIGGFHAVSEEDVAALETLGYVSPSHCTQQMDLIRRRCGEAFVEGGGGKTHRFRRSKPPG